VTAVSEDILDELKKRKLVNVNTIKYYQIVKGVNYYPTKQDLSSELTADMLRDGSWKDKQWKKLNEKSKGAALKGGHLHPLLKVRSLFKDIFVELGFEEMPTSRFVESSFWNFDALF